MLDSGGLYKLAKFRFEEARVLLANNKPDGAVYLCGYALELILKRHIVLTLNWDGYPDTKSEFDQRGLSSFKVHKLDNLLYLAGLEKRMKADTQALARWQTAQTWNSEIRYKAPGSLTQSEASRIIEATRHTINFILKV
jgi:hypothetical protein